MFCAFSGIVLGGRLGALSQIIYVTLGLVGLPIFTQGGGLTYIFKPSFGYLIGFIVCSYVIGYIIERTEKLNFIKVLGTVLFGSSIIYILFVFVEMKACLRVISYYMHLIIWLYCSVFILLKILLKN